MEGGVYIHVPFCKSRCIYCDFYSTTFGQEWKQYYVEALCREMSLRHSEICSSRVHSLYIGGGTPSQLHTELLGRIFESVSKFFSFTHDAEITIEANPDDISDGWLNALKHTPVNRISMGVQTFSDEILRFLRRRHTSRQATEAVELCRRYGYDNISLDLIYGLPGQNMEQWQADVKCVLELDVPHLSAYSLSFEEGTPLSLMLENGALEEVSDVQSWQMYEYLMDETSKAGMVHYEISNFCKPGMHSRHNSSYWHGTPYLGLGPGAHSYDGVRTRRANDDDLKKYVSSNGDVPHSLEVLTDEEVYDELVMTRLRTSEGLPLSLMTESDRKYCMAMSSPHIDAGRLAFNNGILRLTKAGIFVSNDIISDIMR